MKFSHHSLATILKYKIKDGSKVNFLCYLLYEENNIRSNSRNIEYISNNFTEIDQDLKDVYEWKLLNALYKNSEELTPFSELSKRFSTGYLMAEVERAIETIRPFFDQKLHSGKHFAPKYLFREDTLVSPLFLGVKYNNGLYWLYQNGLYSVKDIKGKCSQETFTEDMMNLHLFEERYKEPIYDYIYKGILDPEFYLSHKNLDKYRIFYLFAQYIKEKNCVTIIQDSNHANAFYLSAIPDGSSIRVRVSDDLYKRILTFKDKQETRKDKLQLLVECFI